MTLVDSSVWIDYFRGKVSPQTQRLDLLLGTELLAIGDLILAEVLQGFADEGQFNKARRLFQSLDRVDLCGEKIALLAARNFRLLRKQGVTVRKTIDCFIATYCIENGLELLHADRDFEPFAEHLGLLSTF